MYRLRRELSAVFSSYDHDFAFFSQITICIAFSCLADFERELELAKFYDKICSEVRLVHGGFRDWLGSGPSGVLGLPVQLDGERLESCSEYTGLCRNLQPSFLFPS